MYPNLASQQACAECDSGVARRSLSTSSLPCTGPAIYPTYDQFRRILPEVSIEVFHAAKKLIHNDFNSSQRSSGLDNFFAIGGAGLSNLLTAPRPGAPLSAPIFPGGTLTVSRLTSAASTWQSACCARRGPCQWQQPVHQH